MHRSPLPPVSCPEIADACEPVGLLVLGSFIPAAHDRIPSAGAAVVLLGNAGPAMWRAFVAAGRDLGAPDPLDRWLRETLSPLARKLDAVILFPFDGPPFLPFLQWAYRSGAAFPSPLGLAIHPRFGLWHAYRAALVLPYLLQPPAAPAVASANSPCASCSQRPCLHACPVDAFDGSGFAHDRCLDWLAAPLGDGCLLGGCRARDACPIGREHRYDPEQIAFHMRAQRAMMTLPQPRGKEAVATGR